VKKPGRRDCEGRKKTLPLPEGNGRGKVSGGNRVLLIALNIAEVQVWSTLTSVFQNHHYFSRLVVLYRLKKKG
jgi:hypothetical protein